jgi:2-methylcitrate dehydratase PrpD
MRLTREIARFVVNLEGSGIPRHIYEHAKVAFADWLAVTVAGKDEPLVTKLIRLADLVGGEEQATIVGHGLKKTVLQAALINGAASHALDYDDSLEIFHGHPSVTLFPALLALGEWKEKRGDDFLTAYIIGLQAGAAIGACTGIEHYLSGWHSTSTLGHFASAAGCARLLGLDEKQTIFALGIAGTQASGLKGVFGTMCKPFHAGRASQAGLMAALLAKDGFTSAEDILEGRFGFLQVLGGCFADEALNMLGKVWVIPWLAQKYHASCHFTHSPVEATLEIVKKQGLCVDEIRSIRVLGSRLAIDAASKREPKTGLEGKFSISYCIANAVLRGDTGVGAFADEKVRDPSLRKLMESISVGVDSNLAELESQVIVETVGGKVFSTCADVLKQIPDLDTKKTKIAAKFRSLCTPELGTENTEQLLTTILSLEKLESIGKPFLQIGLGLSC